MLMRVKGDGISEGDVVGALEAILADVPEAFQIRLFVTKEPRVDYYAIVALNAPLARPLDFRKGPALEGRLGLVNTYTPYNPAA